MGDLKFEGFSLEYGGKVYCLDTFRIPDGDVPMVLGYILLQSKVIKSCEKIFIIDWFD